jgi:hypothetical protein
MNFQNQDYTETTFLSHLEQLGLAWWIEAITNNPPCIYYFGPFASIQQAQLYQAGYIEDLDQENAQIVSLKIQQQQPKSLTIC